MACCSISGATGPESDAAEWGKNIYKKMLQKHSTLGKSSVLHNGPPGGERVGPPVQPASFNLLQITQAHEWAPGRSNGRHVQCDCHNPLGREGESRGHTHQCTPMRQLKYAFFPWHSTSLGGPSLLGPPPCTARPAGGSEYNAPAPQWRACCGRWMRKGAMPEPSL